MNAGEGGPFGTVIVQDGRIVGEGYNRVLSTRDPTAHAEVVAIRRACAALDTFSLEGAELYTNGAPCCMCMSSILWARIARVYYALGMEESASIDLGDTEFYEELARPADQRRIVPLEGVPGLRDEARAVYDEWLAKPDRVDF